MSLQILYEDNHCLALAKPPALLTQGVPPGIPTLESMAKDYLRARYHKKGNVYLGIPHRLDRPVSGVVLFARQTVSAQRLAEQFEKKLVSKVYWAIVQGVVTPTEGTWTDWLLKIKAEARTVVVSLDTDGARRADLEYRTLQIWSDRTLLELCPTTGRMHQLRVQCAVRGHPVLGDVQYGSSYPFGPPVELPRERIIALHARSLTFLHPIRYEPITVTAPLPPAWDPWYVEEASATSVTPSDGSNPTSERSSPPNSAP